MKDSKEDDIFPLVVTLYVDVLEDKKEIFTQHLDHHLKSDNWGKHSEASTVYIKNNYFVQSPRNFKTTKNEFAKDLQSLFDVSTKQLIEHCSCEKPITGLAQLGNLGHVTFEIDFNTTKKKFKVSCSEFKSYGDSPDLFAAFENL